ncbi:MAG TPA: DUF6404 family protein [Rhodanobacteraceae bacterium]|nr:DUF6404 family protein [Rhodanobacteraceae bacterium]
MEQHEKIEAMYRHMETLGVGRSTAAPPAWRLMWRLGWDVPPPMFLPFWRLAFAVGLAFGLPWGVALMVVTSLPLLVIAAVAILGGACFGLVFAGIMYGMGRRHGLPPWSEYRGETEQG